MAFTPTFATGFEMGSLEILPFGDRVNAAALTTYKKTGAYSTMLGNNAPAFFRVAVSGSDYYVGAWVYLPAQYLGTDGILAIQAVLDDGKIIEVNIAVGNSTYDAYVDSALVASGTVVIERDNWHHVQVHFIIADAGTIATVIEGIADITYSGDTKPSATTNIVFIKFLMAATSRNSWVDDLTIGTGGWPGDWRFDAIVPNADTATEQWSLSAGADSYALIDEIPPSDSDYLYTATTGQRTLVELADWDGAGKSPQAVVVWTRAWKSDATADQIKQVLVSGATTDVGAAQDLLTSATHVKTVYDNDPNTAAEWTDAAIDAIQVGVDSVIV